MSSMIFANTSLILQQMSSELSHDSGESSVKDSEILNNNEETSLEKKVEDLPCIKKK